MSILTIIAGIIGARVVEASALWAWAKSTERRQRLIFAYTRSQRRRGMRRKLRASGIKRIHLIWHRDPDKTILDVTLKDGSKQRVTGEGSAFYLAFGWSLPSFADLQAFKGCKWEPHPDIVDEEHIGWYFAGPIRGGR